MSLVGNLRTMPLPDILQWISTGRKSGTLHLERRAIEKRIVFTEGLIATSWSNDPRESLGQFLMRDRLITEEQLFKALLHQEERGSLLGAILIAEKRIDEPQLKRALKRKTEETIYDLFLWTEGGFEFKEGEGPGDILVQTEMPVTEVILEGIRRVDEWLRIREVLPSTRCTFRMIGAPQVEDPEERQLLGLAASGRSLAEISMEMRRSEFETASLFVGLHGQGFLVVDAPGVETTPQDTVTTIRDLLKSAYESLQARRYDEALKAYEDVLALDRLNQHAKKGLISVAESRSRDRAVKTIPLDQIPTLLADFVALTREKLDPQEGFVLSRVNGEWDVQSILKLCPMAEEDALLIFSRLLERKLIALKPAVAAAHARPRDGGR
jgi:hypothetical protein